MWKCQHALGARLGFGGPRVCVCVEQMGCRGGGRILCGLRTMPHAGGVQKEAGGEGGTTAAQDSTQRASRRRRQRRWAGACDARCRRDAGGCAFCGQKRGDNIDNMGVRARACVCVQRAPTPGEECTPARQGGEPCLLASPPQGRGERGNARGELSGTVDRAAGGRRVVVGGERETVRHGFRWAYEGGGEKDRVFPKCVQEL